MKVKRVSSSLRRRREGRKRGWRCEWVCDGWRLKRSRERRRSERGRRSGNRRRR